MVLKAKKVKLTKEEVTQRRSMVLRAIEHLRRVILQQPTEVRNCPQLRSANTEISALLREQLLDGKPIDG